MLHSGSCHKVYWPFSGIVSECTMDCFGYTLSLLSLAITLPRKLGQKLAPKLFHSAVPHKTDQVLISPPKWPMACRPRSRRKKSDSCFFSERSITCRQNWFIISCSSFQVQIHLKTMKVYIHVTIANDFVLKDETMLRARLIAEKIQKFV